MFAEIKIFLQSITHWLLLLLIFTVFFFTCNVDTVTLFGRVFIAPVPKDPSFSAELFTMMVRDIVPAGVPLLVTGPMVAFVAQIKIALFLALFFTSPVLGFSIVQYLAPALYKRERMYLYMVSTSACALFGVGALFAYSLIIPATFRVLYTFTEPIGVTAFLGVSEFIGMTLALVFVTGLSFTLPVVMILLTALRVVPALFWWQKFKYTFVFLLIASAIITPDGSGISMALMTLPVSALYGVGALVCGRVEKVSQKNTFTSSSAVNN